jgi:ubiquinone biosynthesis protein COQ9
MPGSPTSTGRWTSPGRPPRSARSRSATSATGFAYYSKRLTLVGVYAACLLVFLDDASEGHAETLAFLDRRIAGVMRFERAKARLKPDPDRHFSPTRLLGRLRYPAR